MNVQVERPAISVESLNFYFGMNQILKNVNLEVRKGEFTSIVGPSGCGKTTFLFLLAKLYRPNSGRIMVDGSNIGLIFQEYNRVLLPWRSVLDNAALHLELLGFKEKQKRHEIAKKYIELVGLTGFEDYFPHALSGGMKQRVQIARVLCTEPSILLLDEPFGSLDAQTKESMQMELLKIFYKKRISSVFVTHDIDEATFLSDEIIILGPRPSTVIGRVEVDIPHPRDSETRFSSKFTTIKREVWTTLRSVMS